MVRRVIENRGGYNVGVYEVDVDDEMRITQIHRYCVYEAFEKMGWLYVPFMLEKPGMHP